MLVVLLVLVNADGSPGTGNTGSTPGTGNGGTPGTGNAGGTPGTGNAGGTPGTGDSSGTPCLLSLWRVARGSKHMFLELIHGLFLT